MEGTLKSWYTYQLVYLVDLCVVKFSILTFYRVISTKRSYRIAIYTVMAIVAAFTVSMVFVNAFECPNPSDAWSMEILFQKSGSCHDLHPIYYGQAAFNILSDVVILLLPMPMLRSVQMRRNKRLALIGIFSVGAIAVIASAARIYALSLWSAEGADVPYEGANILIWSQIEINVAIISASIPSLKPLFNRTFGGSTGRYGAATRQYQYYDRSFGNIPLSRHTNLNSFADPGLDSSVSVSFSPLKGSSPPMGLGSHRNSTSGGIEVGGYARCSDEVNMLHSGATRLERDSGGAGVHVLRSITIETSSRRK